MRRHLLYSFGHTIILGGAEVRPVPISLRCETWIALPLRRRKDRRVPGSSSSLELKSERCRQHGSTHGPHPSCAGTARGQTLAETAGEMDA